MTPADEALERALEFQELFEKQFRPRQNMQYMSCTEGALIATNLTLLALAKRLLELNDRLDTAIWREQ